MSILGWIVFGLICGFLASKIVRDRGAGCLTNIALGLLGAVVGGAIFRALTPFNVFEFNLVSMLVATVGAIIVIYVYYAIRGR